MDVCWDLIGWIALVYMLFLADLCLLLFICLDFCLVFRSRLACQSWITLTWECIACGALLIIGDLRCLRVINMIDMASRMTMIFFWLQGEIRHLCEEGRQRHIGWKLRGAWELRGTGPHV